MEENKDIVPELLERLKEAFRQALEKDKKLLNIRTKIEDGSTNYEEVNAFAVRSGELLADIFDQHLRDDVLPDGKMYYNIGERIFHELYKENFNEVKRTGVAVQEILNASAHIGIRPQEPTFNAQRVESLVNLAAHADLYSDVKNQIHEATINFSQSIVDDVIRENANFHYKSGLSPKIVRIAESNCCKWCRSSEGVYLYPDVPKDVYRRHDNCRCTVTYTPGNGKYKSVWDSSKKRIEKLGRAKDIEAVSYTQNLLKKAQKVEPKITQDLQIAVSHGTGELAGLEYRFKSPDSLKRKLIEKSSEKGVSISGYSKKVTDILRYTDVSGVENLVSDYFIIVEELRQKGYTVVEVTNTFSAPNVPYKGINTLVKTNSGYVFELQFHTPQSLEIKEENHKLYEEMRLSKTSSKRKQELMDLMVKSSNQIEVPVSVDEIKDRR